MRRSRLKWMRSIYSLLLVPCLLPVWSAGRAHGEPAPSQPKLIRGGNLSVEAFDDGFYALRSTTIPGDVLRSEVEADTAAGTLRSSLYPWHFRTVTSFDDALGSGQLLTVTHTGLPGTPDLVCEFRVYEGQPWGDIRVSVSNSTAKAIEVQAIRVLKTNAGAVLQLNGPASQDRVLSDDFSENPVQLMDLGEPKNGLQLGFGSQLTYNKKSGQSIFLGALSADRFLTAFHLLSTTGPDAHLLSYDVSDTGTGAAIGDESKEFRSGHPDPFRRLLGRASIRSD